MTPRELINWRESHNMLVGDMAAALGVTRQTIARWESGDTSIPNFLPLALKGLVFSHSTDWECICPQCTRKRALTGGSERDKRDPFMIERQSTRVWNNRKARWAKGAATQQSGAKGEAAQAVAARKERVS